MKIYQTPAFNGNLRFIEFNSLRVYNINMEIKVYLKTAKVFYNDITKHISQDIPFVQYSIEKINYFAFLIRL